MPSIQNETPFLETLLKHCSALSRVMVPCITLPFEKYLIGGDTILLASAAVPGELARDRLGLEETSAANNI